MTTTANRPVIKHPQADYVGEHVLSWLDPSRSLLHGLERLSSCDPLFDTAKEHTLTLDAPAGAQPITRGARLSQTYKVNGHDDKHNGNGYTSSTSPSNGFISPASPKGKAHPNYTPSRIAPLPPIASTSSAILDPESYFDSPPIGYPDSPSSGYVLPDPSPDPSEDATKAKRRSFGRSTTTPVGPQRSSYVAGSRPPFSPGSTPTSPASSPRVDLASPRQGGSNKKRLSKPPPAPSATRGNGLTDAWEVVEEPYTRPIAYGDTPVSSPPNSSSSRLQSPTSPPPIIRTLGSKSSANYLASTTHSLLNDPSTQAAAELAAWDPATQPHPSSYAAPPPNPVINTPMHRFAAPVESPTSPTEKPLPPPNNRRRSSQPGSGGNGSTIKSVFGGIFGGVTDLLSVQRSRMEISTPYDPVHLTHVGYNTDTGEFTVRLAFCSAC